MAPHFSNLKFRVLYGIPKAPARRPLTQAVYLKSQPAIELTELGQGDSMTDDAQFEEMAEPPEQG
jgi:hypothetical protein